MGSPLLILPYVRIARNVAYILNHFHFCISFSYNANSSSQIEVDIKLLAECVIDFKGDVLTGLSIQGRQGGH